MVRAKKRDIWSPYGHEAARRRLLNERRAQIIVGVLVVVFLYGVFLKLTLDVQETAHGGSADIVKEPQKPFTVTVFPGGLPAFLDSQVEPPEGQNAPGMRAPKENPIWTAVKPFLSLLAPLVGALWLLGRVGTSARGKLAEVNLGVYKGAMPYEMHTVRANQRVFTFREVNAHVFGKQKEDFLFGSYLHAPPLAVRQLLGDDNYSTAKVTKLHQGRRPRVTISAPAPRPTGVRAVWDGVNGWIAERMDEARKPARRR